MPTASMADTKDLIYISFNASKTPDEGEDADPVCIKGKDCCFISVCDGMGGAGSCVYIDNDSQHTGAYIASRLVNQVVEEFFSPIVNEDRSFDVSVLEALQSLLVDKLKDRLKGLRREEEVRLKSRLLKDLPTTFSGIFIQKEATAGHWIVHSLWAGDSRNYCLSSSHGLQQLSVDDLQQKYDPFENLRKDSPLKNVISADGDFIVHCSNALDFEEPCLLLTVTDGCYGYYNTPMEFEDALLSALQNAGDQQEWEDNLKKNIGLVSGDDYSLALVALGYTDFGDIKETFSKRKERISETYIKQLAGTEEDQKEVQKRLWDIYRPTYSKYINIYEEGR